MSAPVPSPCEESGAVNPAPDVDADDSSEASELTRPSGWGPFRITPKQPLKSSGRRFGGFEASCPFHRKNAKTGCKKYLQLRSNTEHEKDACLRALRAWCNAALLYDRQRNHLQHFTSIDHAPSDDLVRANQIADGPSVRPETDEDLDIEHGAVPPAPKVKAKAKGKVKARPKPKGGRGRARGRGGGGSGRRGAKQ